MARGNTNSKKSTKATPNNSKCSTKATPNKPILTHQTDPTMQLTLLFVGDAQRSLHDVVGVLVVQHLCDGSGVRQFSNDQRLGRAVCSMETFFNDLSNSKKKKKAMRSWLGMRRFGSKMKIDSTVFGRRNSVLRRIKQYPHTHVGTEFLPGQRS